MSKIIFLCFYVDYSIGVCAMSNELKKAGHDVSIIFFKVPDLGFHKVSNFSTKRFNNEFLKTDGEIYAMNREANKWKESELNLLIDLLNDIKPDILGISARSYDNELVKIVIPKIREKCNTVTIAGGYGPSLDPELYADLVDYVFIGEAENCIVKLVNKLAKGDSLNDFDNIFYKHNASYKMNKLSKPDISFFKHQFLPEKTYYIDFEKILDLKGRKKIVEKHTYSIFHAYSTFVGRGCIGTCSYCTAGQWSNIYTKQGIKIGKRRNRPLDDVMNELIKIKDQEYTFIFFRDSFLCADIEYLRSFFTKYRENICIPFWAQLVPQQMLNHPDILELAVDAGFVATALGIQSGSDRVNKEIFNRHIKNETTVEYAKLLSKYDIIQRYDFIIFNPAETEKDIIDTFKLIQSLPKKPPKYRTMLSLSRLSHYLGAPLFDWIGQYPETQDEDELEYNYCISLLYLICFVMPNDEFNKLYSDFKTKKMSSKKLLSLYQSYLSDNKIEFIFGTHDIPDTITTHRYKRILEKNNYKDVIIWGEKDYYNKIKHIFDNLNVSYIEGFSEENYKADFSNTVFQNSPIFICGNNSFKQKSKLYLRKITATHNIYI